VPRAGFSDQRDVVRRDRATRRDKLHVRRKAILVSLSHLQPPCDHPLRSGSSVRMPSLYGTRLRESARIRLAQDSQASDAPLCFERHRIHASCHTHTLARGSPNPPRYDGRRRGRASLVTHKHAELGRPLQNAVNIPSASVPDTRKRFLLLISAKCFTARPLLKRRGRKGSGRHPGFAQRRTVQDFAHRALRASALKGLDQRLRSNELIGSVRLCLTDRYAARLLITSPRPRSAFHPSSPGIA
jgi:hypothetical protein